MAKSDFQVAIEQFLATVDEYDEIAAALAANTDLMDALSTALGGGLPDWWTVVSTAGSESVTIAGMVVIEPPADVLYGQHMIFSEDNDNTMNYRVLWEGPAGTAKFAFDSGGADMIAGHLLFHAADGSTGLVRANAFTFSDFTTGRVAGWSPERGLYMNTLVPSETPDNGYGFIYIDDAVGAPRIKVKCKDSAGTPFTLTLAVE